MKSYGLPILIAVLWSQALVLELVNLLNNFFHMLSNISNTRDSVTSRYPNTEKRVENSNIHCLQISVLIF